MGILSIILLLWWLTIGKERGYFSKLKTIFDFKPLLLMIFFFAFSYLSLFWTENFENAKIALNYYKYYWIMVPVLFTSLTKKEAIIGLYIFILSIGGYSLFSILIYLNIWHINQNATANPRGILSYSIVTSYMAIGFISSLFISYYNKSTVIKIVFSTTAFLCFVGIFINNGRAGQLSFFITLGILFIVYRKYSFKPNILISIILVFTASFYLLNYFNKIDRFKNGLYELQNLEKNNFNGSWGERAYMWHAGAYIIKENPILGTGVGDNIDEFIDYTKTHPSEATWLRSFHNQHLDTLTRYGIVGYLLFLSSILLLLYYLKNLKLFFGLGIVFFSTTFFSSLADILLLMKPYNNVFMLIFLLLSIIVYKSRNTKATN
ncbi:O-antigen ligase family protein [Sulfurimonas sp.]|uniref:O-antigen ligase family protein n=1 Tax=Sulfurimonas sp. TaxID=2022749 RepID=UPI0035616D1D